MPAASGGNPGAAADLDNISAGRDVRVTHINVYVADSAAAGRVVAQSDDGGLTVDGVAIAAPADDQNPFKGLDAFDESDAERFYGRSAITGRLVEALDRLTAEGADAPRLLPILGPSGSGKSSVARAGLIPALVHQPLAGLPGPRVVYLTPRANPLAELALVLARVEPGERHPATVSAEFEQLLRQPDPDGSGRLTGLRRIAGSLAHGPERPLVILVDQFEELFVLTASDDDRRLFIDGLLEAVSDQGGRVSAILTMRSDFLGSTMSHRRLNALIASHSVIVPTMTENELRQTIEMPAEAAGRPLPPGVVDRLVAETEDRAGALPLLQFALSRIWEGMVAGQEAGQVLRDIGGVGGALAGRAEALFQELDPADRAVAKRAFLATISLGEGARDTRRRARLAEIVPADADPAAVKDVVAGFARKHERLMTIAGTGDEITIEVTHEAIFDHWTRLDGWLAQEREDLRFQRRLTDAVTSWESSHPPRPSGGLWRHPALDGLIEYHAAHKSEMTALQLEFFVASRRHDRWSRMFRLGGVAATLLAIVAGGFSWYAWEKSAEATQAAIRTERIQSTFLADLARQQTTAGDATLGVLLASAALSEEREVVPAAEAALLESLAEMREILAIETDLPVSSVGLGANGRYALIVRSVESPTAAPRSPVIVVDTEKGEEVPLPAAVQTGRFAALHPMEPVIAVEIDGKITLYGLENGNLETVIGEDLGQSQFQIVFSPDGHQLAAVSRLLVQVWELEGRQSIGALDLPPMTTWDPELTFADDRLLVSQGYATTVADRPTLDTPYRNHARGLEGGALSPDGTILVELWSRPIFHLLGGAAEEPERMQMRWSGTDDELGSQLPPEFQYIRKIAFAPSGSALIASGQDGISHWYPLDFVSEANGRISVEIDSPIVLSPDPDLVRRAVDERNVPNSEIRDAARNATTPFAISPGGRHLAIGGFYGQIALWALRAGGPPHRLAALSAHGPGSAITHLAFSGDGEELVSSGTDGTVRVWSVAPAATLAIDNPHGEIIERFAAPNGAAVTLRSTGSSRDALNPDAIAFSPDGRLIATGGGGRGGDVYIWEAATGAHRATLKGTKEWIHSVEFSADGATLLTAGEDGRIVLWDVETWQSTAHLGGEEIPDYGWIFPWEAVFSPDSGEILSATEDGEIVLWGRDGLPGQVSEPAQILVDQYDSLEIHGVGYLGARAIAVLRGDNQDDRIILWGVRAERPIYQDSVPDLTFATAIQGDLLALGHQDGSISLLRPTGELLEDRIEIRDEGRLAGHPGSQIEALAISADRRRLASTANDGRVKLWDLERMVEVGELAGPGTPGNVVALSADGSMTAAGFRWAGQAGDPDRLMIWHTPIGRDALVEEAETRRVRDLTATERLRFYVDLE